MRGATHSLRCCCCPSRNALRCLPYLGGRAAPRLHGCPPLPRRILASLYNGHVYIWNYAEQVPPGRRQRRPPVAGGWADRLAEAGGLPASPRSCIMLQIPFHTFR